MEILAAVLSWRFIVGTAIVLAMLALCVALFVREIRGEL